VGEHYAIHVYEAERPVATFHTVADARRAVDAVNRAVPQQPSSEPRSLEDIERWWGESEADITALVAEVRRLRAADADAREFADRFADATHDIAQLQNERDALREAIQGVEAIRDEMHGKPAGTIQGWAAELTAALAAAGVDREDTEQPQLDEVYVADLKAAASIAATPWTDEVGDTGQAGEPQRPCRHCGHYHRALCLTDNPHLDCDCPPQTGQADEPQRCVVCHLTLTRIDPPGGLCCVCLSCVIGQVVPQQPTCIHGETEPHPCGAMDCRGTLKSWCPGPSGDTTGEQQQ
jgi:hypothetical protein